MIGDRRPSGNGPVPEILIPLHPSLPPAPSPLAPFPSSPSPPHPRVRRSIKRRCTRFILIVVTILSSRNALDPSYPLPEHSWGQHRGPSPISSDHLCNRATASSVYIQTQHSKAHHTFSQSILSNPCHSSDKPPPLSTFDPLSDHPRLSSTAPSSWASGNHTSSLALGSRRCHTLIRYLRTSPARWSRAISLCRSV